ncbi:hypothetical protein CEXT_74271 [Caerostris extrusa]|uniref:Uncharacterized protein n=1 Tax=Caerostris extrusa TaxID=172846 RepID=A0AAV4SFG7_CAEEX|nr:hypothetical protein CEXT_74271 [Caerostris extrusa]
MPAPYPRPGALLHVENTSVSHRGGVLHKHGRQGLVRQIRKPLQAAKAGRHKLQLGSSIGSYGWRSIGTIGCSWGGIGTIGYCWGGGQRRSDLPTSAFGS